MFFRSFFCASFAAVPAMAEAPVLGLPIDCELGKTCYIQQYMDLQEGDGVRDFGCGAASYEGHKGTDFRLLTTKDMEEGVDVLASADGRVLGVRNNMPDKLAVTDADRAAYKGKECGNGLVLDHGGGWQTQYCHLKQGTVSVKKGQFIKAGDVLGQVGLSGKTQFPHVHLSVRKNGKKIDPFLNPNEITQCGELPKGNLWADDLQDALAYQPTQIINLGFADGRITMDDIEREVYAAYTPSRRASALVGYVRVINLAKGDQIRMTLTGPEGEIISKTYDPVDRSKAQFMQFAGKKAPRGGWAAGNYTATAEIIRNGRVLLAQNIERSTQD